MTRKNIDRRILSMRSAIEVLKENNELITIDKEVDPIYEISGILKSLDGGPAVLFENIKGYPGTRDIGNFLCTRSKLSKVFGLDSPIDIFNWGREALFKGTPAKVVNDAPCQEVVITNNIDVLAKLPVLKYTEEDVGRIFGGGNYLITGEYFDNGTEVSFKRTHVQGKDWASVMAMPGSHIALILRAHQAEKIPVTMNIGTPPAVMIVAATGMLHTVMPWGGDELGIAGTLQGAPVEICKAKTVDAYCIAQSEWVVEGYIHGTRDIWESKEAEKLGTGRVLPFFPEWPKYMGRARKAHKFEVTAITHRKDRPICFTPLADSFEDDIMSSVLKEAYFYHVAEGHAPGLVQDVRMINPMAISLKVQVKKRNSFDDRWIKSLINTAFAEFTGMRLVVFVDEDVDISNGEDLFWAMATRVNPDTGLVISPGGMGAGMVPAEITDTGDGKILSTGISTKGIGLDATIPYNVRWNFARPHHPVNKIDLRKLLSDEQIRSIRALQSDYAKLLARIGG